MLSLHFISRLVGKPISTSKRFNTFAAASNWLHENMYRHAAFDGDLPLGVRKSNDHNFLGAWRSLRHHRRTLCGVVNPGSSAGFAGPVAVIFFDEVEQSVFITNDQTRAHKRKPLLKINLRLQ